MSITTLKSKIVSLEAELEVLREETKHMTFSGKNTPKKSFASLEGLLGGKGQFSEKEIEESEIHLVRELK